MHFYFKIQPLKLTSVLVILACAVLNQGCDFSGQPSENTSEIQGTPVDESLRQANEFSLQQEVHTAGYFYRTGYTILSGQEFFSNERLQVSIQKEIDQIFLTIRIRMDSTFVYPEVYNSGFSMTETADYFTLVLSGSTPEHKKLFFEEQHYEIYNNEVEFHARFSPAVLSVLNTGSHRITLDIQSELCSFFGVGSGIHPVQCQLQFQYNVHDLYKTTVYFKKLVLNEKNVSDFLGDNDYSNGAPETGISMSCNGHIFLSQHTKNSYELHELLQTDLYHLNADDSILVHIMDFDYGFNSSDLIESLVFSLKELETGTYQKYTSGYVDELWIYAQSHGKVN
jgi:hypothetical protein